MKIYTKTGDDGSTGLQGGKRVSKSDLRIIAYGTIDEINSSLGIVLANNIDSDIQELLVKIQNELFTLGSDLSNPDLENHSNRVTPHMVEYLEKKIDELEEEVKPITNFILPGGTLTAALVHATRTIARRAETQAVALSKDEQINDNCQKYLNRLSDLFFVVARVINKRSGKEDVIWKP